MGTDGSNPRQLSPGPDAVPVVSKDGRWVLYNHVQPESQECRVPIEGGRPERLGEVGGQIQEAFKKFAGVSQSPDGRLLTGWVPDSRGYTLAVVPLDGSGPRVELQAPIPIHGFIRWAPDGRSLLYEVLGRAVIYRKTLDKRPASVYLDLKEGTRCLFAISRDGKQIAYAHVMERSDVVLIRDTAGEEKQK